MYLKLITFAISGLLFATPAGAMDCGPRMLGAANGVPGKRFTLTVPPLNPKFTPVGWLNHASMLAALGVVPVDLQLSASEEMLPTGHYTSPALFLQAFDALATNAAGNLLLRFLGSRAELIAKEVGRPELAGDLLVALLNIAPLRHYDFGDFTSVRPLSAAHLFQKMGFEIYPGLFDLVETLGWGETATNHATLPLLWLSMTNMVGMLNGDQPPFYTARVNAEGALDSMGGAYERSDLDFPFQMRSARRVATEVHFGPNNPHELLFEIFQQTPGPQFLIPSSGETLRLLALPWSLTVSLKGAEIAAFVPLSTSVAQRMQTDIWLFERVMYPLLLETGSYAKTMAAKEFAGVNVTQNGDYLPLSKDTIDFSTLGPNGARDRAIRYAMASTLRLYRGKDRILGLQHLFERLLLRDQSKELSYATFERIARESELPIHLLAYNRLPPGHIRFYPRLPIFEGRTVPPSRHLLISIVKPEEAQYNLELAGLTAETNLELLHTSTGTLRSFDATRN